MTARHGSRLLVRKEVHQDAGAVKIEQPTLLGKFDRTTYIYSVLQRVPF